MSKYYVLRIADMQEFLPDEARQYLAQIHSFIEQKRQEKGKTTDDPLFVLNLRDRFARPAMDAYIRAASNDPELRANPEAAKALQAARDIHTMAKLKFPSKLPD